MEEQGTEFDVGEDMSERRTISRDSGEEKQDDIYGIRSSLVWWLNNKV